jgi:hypothetical protein
MVISIYLDGMSSSHLIFDLTHKLQALSDEARFWGAFGFYALLTLVRRFKLKSDNLIFFECDVM